MHSCTTGPLRKVRILMWFKMKMNLTKKLQIRGQIHILCFLVQIYWNILLLVHAASSFWKLFIFGLIYCTVSFRSLSNMKIKSGCCVAELYCWHVKICPAFVGCRRQRKRGRDHHKALRQRQDDLQGDPSQLGRLHQVPRRMREMQRDPASGWENDKTLNSAGNRSEYLH